MTEAGAARGEPRRRGDDRLGERAASGSVLALATVALLASCESVLGLDDLTVRNRAGGEAGAAGVAGHGDAGGKPGTGGAGHGGSGGELGGGGGAKTVCNPGEPLSCAGTVAMVCNAAGTAPENAQDCASIAAACVQGTCETGLVAYFPFDEGAGTQTADGAWNYLIGAVEGADWVPGHLGNALGFDGVADVVNVGDVLNSLAVPLTISVWLRPEPGNTADALSVLATDAQATGTYSGAWLQLEPSAGYAVALHYGDGEAGIGPGNRRSKKSSQGIPTGEWTRVTAVIKGPTFMHIYFGATEIDGVYSGSGAAMANTTAGQLRIAAGTDAGNATHFKGAIDEVRIYARALSSDEVAKLP